MPGRTKTYNLPRSIHRTCPYCELPTMHGEFLDPCICCVIDSDGIVRRLKVALDATKRDRDSRRESNRNYSAHGLTPPHDMTAVNRAIRRIRAKIRRREALATQGSE